MVLLTRNKDIDKFQYKLGEFLLPYLDSFTYLGVTISSDLSWSQQITSVYNRATRVLNFVKRNVSICNPTHKSLAYISLVRPHLEYAAAVWDPYYIKDIEQINKIQNRAARFCRNDYRYTTSVSGLVSQLGWPSLVDRRKIARLTELYKIINNISPISGELLRKPLSRTRATSYGQTFIGLASRTNSFKFSFFPRTIVDWNSLPPDICSLDSVEVFRTHLTDYVHLNNTINKH